MTSLVGNLRKMRVAHEDPVRYWLRLGDEEVDLAPLVGRHVSLEHTGTIQCVACGRLTRKSFQQGYCFPCFRSLPECDSCIVKPELCHYDAGTCRDPRWGLANCMTSHVVYLANSSGLKVGITRASQVPTRWIDQGACQAIPVCRVATRRASGVLEVALKAHFADRTDWRRMLRGAPEPLDLTSRRDDLLADARGLRASLASAGAPVELEPDETTEPRVFNYPVLRYPEKVKSLDFQKTPRVEGELQGIKGQYLIFPHGVINMRKFGGYEVRFTA